MLTVMILLLPKPVEIELDTGATMTVMPQGSLTWYFPGVQLAHSEVEFVTYTRDFVTVQGEKVTYQQQCFHEACDCGPINNNAFMKLVIVEGTSPQLLGRNWLYHIKCIQPHSPDH